MIEQGLIVAGLILMVLLFLAIYFRRWIAPKSLSNRLLVAFMGVAGISVLVVVGFVLLRIDTILTERTGSEYVNLASTNSERLAEQLAVQVARIQQLSRSSGVVSQSSFQTRSLDAMSSEQRTTHFQQREAEWSDPESPLHGMLLWNYAGLDLNALMSSFPIFAQLILTDAYGGLAGIAGENTPVYYYGNESWWREVRDMGAGEIYVGNPQISSDGRTATIDIAVPVQSSSRRESAQPGTQEAETDGDAISGVLWARLRLNDLTVFADIKEDLAYELALVDNNSGLLLYSTAPHRIGTSIPAEVQKYINDQPTDWDVDPDQTGENIVHGHAKLEPSTEQAYLNPLNWAIIIQSAEPDLPSKLRDFLQPILLGGVIALIVASVAGMWLSWQLTRPIKALTNTTTVMVEGHLEQKAPISGPSELQTLARSFNSMTDQLRQVLAGLEQQVVARTERLEIVATLGERLSAILNLEELLAQVVNQIQQKFHYYHAHIYLLDDEGETLVVTAGTGEAGMAMTAAGHSIPVNASISLVARAARLGEIVRVDNVRQMEGWLPNLLLPDTCSEMAVPIMLEGQVVGVLDVQQDKVAGLDEGDAALLRSLANHVAVAIRNARLFEEVRTALAEAREVQRRYVEQAWDRSWVVRQGRSRVQFSLGESTTLSETELAEARRQALACQEPIIVTLDGNETKDGESDLPSSDIPQVLVAPIRLGEVTIGNLQLHGIDAQRKWAENELTFINAIADQVAQTAENLRLLNETRERASREQLVSQISDRLRRAPDIETLMKTAVEEVARVLDPGRTFVYLGPAAELNRTPPAGVGDGEPPDETAGVRGTEDEPATLSEDSAEFIGDEIEQAENVTSQPVRDS